MYSRFALTTAAWLCACSLLVAGCTLVSDYDQVTDQSLTALQKKTDDFITALKDVTQNDSGAGGFDQHQAFYQEVDRDLRQLEFRVTSIPQNDDTVKLVDNIRTVILGKPAEAGGPSTECTGEGASLRDLHCLPANKAKGPSAAALEIARRNINQTISAALSLELAKKQGLESNN